MIIKMEVMTMLNPKYRKEVVTISSEQTMEKVIQLLANNGLTEVLVENSEKKVVGMVTSMGIVRALANGFEMNTKVDAIMEECVTVTEQDINDELQYISCDVCSVVDDQGQIIGILGKNEQISFLKSKMNRVEKELQEARSMLEMMKIVLNSAYEGVVVIKADGVIYEINKAYCQFLGIKREEAIGKHVTEVIENTRLHVCIESGIPERGFIQKIYGQDMVVHRIPIWSEGEVIGAIGMLIFQGVSELYEIFNRLQNLSRNASQKEVVAKPKKDKPQKKISEFDGIVGRSAEIVQIKHMIRRAARVPFTVLITGESGTGKEVLARAIHDASLYSGGNFVSVNCAAIPEPLLEAELFGYEDGAFTGAKKGGKIGKFQLAHKGTLFLDEIGDMPLYMQAKILRVLEERKIEKVGGLDEIEVDVRIIAATNKPLEDMIHKGQFREDLFFRLNVIRIQIPSLRERRMDIPYLLAYHMDRICQQIGIEPKEFTRDAIHELMNYSWPGNIRELVNTVEWLVGMVEGRKIKKEHLPSHFFYHSFSEKERQGCKVVQVQETNKLHEMDWRDLVKQNEREKIKRALIEEKGNKSATARKLGIHRSTLYEKIKKYNL
jgi:transcriptional regulator with PAS, ATPase and Fis domain